MTPNAEEYRYRSNTDHMKTATLSVAVFFSRSYSHCQQDLERSSRHSRHRLYKRTEFAQYSGCIVICDSNMTTFNRTYAGLRQWISLLLLGITSGPALGGILDCDRLSDTQHSICEDLVLCSLIEDSVARAQCFGAVLRAGSRRVQPSLPIAPTEASEASEAEEATEVEEAAEVAEVKVIAIESQTPAEPAAEERSARNLPPRFSATVTNVRSLVHDRQLVLLDDSLLFEGEGPAFKIGDFVDVASPRWRYFNTYRIGRPKGRQLDFQRLKCELIDLDLNDDTKRKCSAMTDSE